MLLKEQSEWRRMTDGEYHLFEAPGPWHDSDVQRLLVTLSRAHRMIGVAGWRVE